MVSKITRAAGVIALFAGLGMTGTAFAAGSASHARGGGGQVTPGSTPAPAPGTTGGGQPPAQGSVSRGTPRGGRGLTGPRGHRHRGPKGGPGRGGPRRGAVAPSPATGGSTGPAPTPPTPGASGSAPTRPMPGAGGPRGRGTKGRRGSAAPGLMGRPAPSTGRVTTPPASPSPTAAPSGS